MKYDTFAKWFYRLENASLPDVVNRKLESNSG